MIYYSHFSSLAVALVIGIFVFLNDRKSLISKVLLMFTLTFATWVFFDMILWATGDPSQVIFFWSIIVPIELLFYFLALYITYLFINKKDVAIGFKLFSGLFFLPIFFLMATKYNITAFDYTSCDLEAIEGPLCKYLYYTEIFIIFWLVAFFIKSYKNIKKEDKIKSVLFFSGILILLLSFSLGNLTIIFEMYPGLEQYKLFGMPIFVGFLAYLIVRYKAFNVKLIATQAMMFALVILIGSQFAFIRNNTNKILTAITLTIAVVFGWILVRSVKREVKQREELEIANGEIEKRNGEIENRNNKLKKANKEISERKEQLQKMADSLAIANDKLQKLDMAKTEFVSMASHQLRTPPTPIKGYSSMLLEGSYGELNAEQKKAIENISNANNQQIAFVEDLLSVSRIESGSLKFQFEKCHIEEFCQEVIDNLALKAKDKNLYLDYKIPAKPLPEITIDGAKVREVISNLVDNAIKYTLKGGVTLYVELCVKKETGCLKKPHLRITVSDTGIGIPADEIPYLFAKFSRGKDTTRLNTGGTGLGLYVVKMITEANGGKVWIESPGANMGTKFILELPLEPEKETLERNG
jgi:signal transduction histidine kinase